LISYKNAGLYLIEENNTKTIINAVDYKDRPAQADALHIDIWYKGKNIIFDPGTYKYNTQNKFLNFYHGTRGHNTLTIGGYNQMLKGSRFMWYYWTKVLYVQTNETESTYEFEGQISAFPEVGDKIWHKRKVIKYKGIPKWKIVDSTNYSGVLSIEQRWNIIPEYLKEISITSFTKNREKIQSKTEPGWYSELYGQKIAFQQNIFSVQGDFLETIIELA
jgi:hypothetical protein